MLNRIAGSLLLAACIMQAVPVQAAADPAPALTEGTEPGYRPSDPAALDAANEASGVLSPAASLPANRPNSQPDGYSGSADFLKLPPGRRLGPGGVAVDSHGTIWVSDRCGAADCGGSSLDPILAFDAQGNFLKSFGHGLLLFPHGISVDRQDHIWITDAGCVAPPGLSRSPAFTAACTNGHTGDGKGHTVMEFDQDGKLLLTLGTPGVPGSGPSKFNRPSSVVISPEGTIFVADSHESGDGFNARVTKFDRTGRFLQEWGSQGSAAGQMRSPHCLAMDNEGRVYVADRENNRIQVFEQDGRLVRILTQFSRASGIYIDANDILYASDSESRSPYGYGYHPGWTRGIRVGSVRDGVVTAFIPDGGPPDSLTSGGEGLWADTKGGIYVAEPSRRAIVKYVKP